MVTSQLPQALLAFFGILFPFRFPQFVTVEFVTIEFVMVEFVMVEFVTVECVAFRVFSVFINRLVTFGLRDLIG